MMKALRSLALLGAVLVPYLAGCGGSGGTADGGAGGGDGDASDGDGGDDAGVCAADGGSGTLSVRIAGVPDAGGVVFVDGLLVAESRDMTVNAGIRNVSANHVAPHGPLFRTAYQPAVDVPNPCVKAGQTTTVTVTYTVVPGSGKLWLGSSAAAKAMVAYAPDALAASGAPGATVAADTAGSGGFAFDTDGNLWVLGATVADPPLARYPASALGTSGAKTPDITIDSPSFGTGIPRPQVLTFDRAGTLWVSVVSADKLVSFLPDQIKATGSPTAIAEVPGINAPSGMAFSSLGDLFVSSGGDATVVRVDFARLGGIGTVGGDLAITVDTPGPVVGALTAPEGLAFDFLGNLWANFGGTLVQLTPDDIAGTGTRTVTPAVQITTDVLSLPHGIVFDELGGLWLAYSAGKFGRLGPTQLAGSAGSVTPEVVISSPDVAYAGWFGFYPAPPSTPLIQRLP